MIFWKAFHLPLLSAACKQGGMHTRAMKKQAPHTEKKPDTGKSNKSESKHTHSPNMDSEPEPDLEHQTKVDDTPTDGLAPTQQKPHVQHKNSGNFPSAHIMSTHNTHYKQLKASGEAEKTPVAGGNSEKKIMESTPPMDQPQGTTTSTSTAPTPPVYDPNNIKTWPMSAKLAHIEKLWEPKDLIEPPPMEMTEEAIASYNETCRNWVDNSKMVFIKHTRMTHPGKSTNTSTSTPPFGLGFSPEHIPTILVARFLLRTPMINTPIQSFYINFHCHTHTTMCSTMEHLNKINGDSDLTKSE